MKRILSLALVLCMILSFSVAAFADDEIVQSDDSTVQTATSSEATTFTFDKVYETTAGKTPAKIPTETLHFDVVADDDNPDDTMITIEDGQGTEGKASNEITVNVPAYSQVGKYNYTITENVAEEDQLQGVTYSTDPITVQVFVANDGSVDGEEKMDGYFDVQVVFTKKVTVTDPETGTKTKTEGKVEEIVNKYDLSNGPTPDPDPDPDPEDETYGLRVKKTVSGSLASTTYEFSFTVTFTAEKPVNTDIDCTDTSLSVKASEFVLDSETGLYTASKTFTLSDGDFVDFNWIPAGVTYTVVEDSSYAEEDTTDGNDRTKGYTVTGNNATGTVEADGSYSATVNNDKQGTANTGISLDVIPYIALLVIATAGLAVVLTRKRTNED